MALELLQWQSPKHSSYIKRVSMKLRVVGKHGKKKHWGDIGHHHGCHKY
jgi:hypothetical protein